MSKTSFIELSDDDLIFSILKLYFQTKCKIDTAPTTSGNADL